MQMYDVIIIGSGPAGLTASIYTARANLKTLVVAGAKWGGQLMLTTLVENFPGFPEGIQGPELMANMRSQAEHHGVEFVDDDFHGMDFSKATSPFSITIGDKAYQGKTILIATGADTKWLGINGEQERIGRGVSSCAPCDAPFFRNKKVIVVGGGDSAMEEAIVLTGFAEHVTIVYRGEALRASQIMQEKVKSNPKITILYNTVLTEILGENKVDKAKLLDTRDQQESEIVTDGVFVAIGHTPNTRVFKGIAVDEKGYVLQEKGTHTNIDGVFVAGDVQDDRYQQAVTAAGFGCMAALDIERYLREQNM
jgi:thioredoxin reductase (NADPH)